jgi:hypothetical protein
MSHESDPVHPVVRNLEDSQMSITDSILYLVPKINMESMEER